MPSSRERTSIVLYEEDIRRIEALQKYYFETELIGVVLSRSQVVRAAIDTMCKRLGIAGHVRRPNK